MKGKMKFVSLVFLALECCLLKTAIAKTDVPVDILVNENYILTGVSPIIRNGTVLAPIRDFSNALGCMEVYWEQGTKTASVVYSDKTIKLQAKSNMAEVDGEEKQLAAATEIINGSMMVPIRFMAENFNCDVKWNSKTYTVEISADNYEVASEHIDRTYTSDELFWLARIIHAEAQGESMDGKLGVGNVILNRVKSNEFANTIYEVIFDQTNGVQFTPTANGAIYNNPEKDSYIAAKNALRGKKIVGDSLFFCNPKISTNFWIMNNRKYYKTIGGHDFYL